MWYVVNTSGSTWMYVSVPFERFCNSSLLCSPIQCSDTPRPRVRVDATRYKDLHADIFVCVYTDLRRRKLFFCVFEYCQQLHTRFRTRTGVRTDEPSHPRNRNLLRLPLLRLGPRRDQWTRTTTGVRVELDLKSESIVHPPGCNLKERRDS